VNADEMDVVWTDPLEGMEHVPLRQHIPDHLYAGRQTRRDQAFVLHRIAKTGYIWASHAGAEERPDNDDIPWWPSAQQIEAAARKEVEWERIARKSGVPTSGRRTTHAPVDPASNGGGSTHGSKARRTDDRPTPPFDGSWDDSYLTVGDEQLLQCRTCGVLWIRRLRRGRRPTQCPDCDTKIRG
jgi:hypothetical protein